MANALNQVQSSLGAFTRAAFYEMSPIPRVKESLSYSGVNLEVFLEITVFFIENKIFCGQGEACNRGSTMKKRQSFGVFAS